MATAPLSPARLAFLSDGTPMSSTFNDIYYSSDGGPGQAQHVFLQGNDLPKRWANQRNFTLLENGFGSGLNFLCTWAAWRDDPLRPEKLHYLATELHPLQVNELAQLHQSWPHLTLIAEELRLSWPILIQGFHRIELAAGRVVLTLMFGDAETSLRKLRAEISAFYLDGFDPRKNPQMWSETLFRRYAQLAAPGATFSTWCAAGQVRRSLIAAGFEPKIIPGFGRKRDMLAGKIIDRPGLKSSKPPSPHRHALVIGAGLAGCAIAERLAARGWRIDLFDRHATPAGGASGNLAGIVRPLLSRDDNLTSRLNRACFLHLARSWLKLNQSGLPARRHLNGLLQIARDAAHEIEQRVWLATTGFPSNYVQFIDQATASKYMAAKTPHGGWWFPQGGWASPPCLCRAWLHAGGAHIHFHGHCEIAHVQQIEGRWHLFDAHACRLADAEHVIFANGASLNTTPMEQLAKLPIHPVRGQVSLLAAGTLPPLSHAVCGKGYLTPAVDGMHCLGASYVRDFNEGFNSNPTISEHTENLQRLTQILSSVEPTIDPNSVMGRVSFRATTPDHLPLVGALPDWTTQTTGDTRLKTFPRQPGLYGLLGLGSRGLVWSALLAEHLACQINGEALPLEGDQADAIDPARFALRMRRHSR